MDNSRLFIISDTDKIIEVATDNFSNIENTPMSWSPYGFVYLQRAVILNIWLFDSVFISVKNDTLYNVPVKVGHYIESPDRIKAYKTFLGAFDKTDVKLSSNPKIIKFRHYLNGNIY